MTLDGTRIYPKEYYKYRKRPFSTYTEIPEMKIEPWAITPERAPFPKYLWSDVRAPPYDFKQPSTEYWSNYVNSKWFIYEKYENVDLNEGRIELAAMASPITGTQPPADSPLWVLKKNLTPAEKALWKQSKAQGTVGVTLSAPYSGNLVVDASVRLTAGILCQDYPETPFPTGWEGECVPCREIFLGVDKGTVQSETHDSSALWMQFNDVAIGKSGHFQPSYEGEKICLSTSKEPLEIEKGEKITVSITCKMVANATVYESDSSIGGVCEIDMEGNETLGKVINEEGSANVEYFWFKILPQT